MKKPKSQVSLSVDVEAIPSRTREGDKISRLMWGNFPNGQYGVPEIARIFKKFGAPATFFVEYFSAKLYGKKSVFSVGEYIAREGFRVEMHAHPEVLKTLNLESSLQSFATGSLSQQLVLLKEIKELRDENLASPGKIFRAGSLKYNADTIRAAAFLEIPYLSNFYVPPHMKLNESRSVPFPFRWDAGPVELPVSFCIDEIIQAGADWKEKLSNLLPSKYDVRHFFIHSWSLTRRDKEGFHDTPDDGYRARLEEIVEYLSLNCDLVDIVPEVIGELPCISLLDLAESIDGRPSAEFRYDHVVGSVRLSPAHLARSKCQYQLHYKTPNACGNDDIPACLAPIDVGSDQSSVTLSISCGSIIRTLLLVLSADSAVVQLERDQIPFDEVINETILAIFKMLPDVQEIVFKNLYGRGLLSSPFVNAECTGSVYVLDLPESFEDYAENAVNHDFLRRIEKSWGMLSQDFANHSIRFFGGAGDSNLSADLFEEIIAVVRNQMLWNEKASNAIRTDPYTPAWIKKNFPIYQKSGCCGVIKVDGRIVAVSMNLVWSGSLYCMANGFFDALGGNYHLSEILFLNLIRRSIEARFDRVILNDGDCEFEEQMGGKKVKLYSGRMFRPSAAFRTSLVRKIENSGSLLGYSLRGVCLAAGVGSKYFLEGPVSKSLFKFDAHTATSIPAGWRSAAQVMNDAMLLCLDAIPPSTPPDGAFDWNCGVGRNLLALHEYFGCRVGGSVLDSGLRDIALSNLESAGVANPGLFLWDGSAPFQSSVLKSYDLFFAYNPAHLKIMEMIVDAMVVRCASHSGKIRFIYVNPVFDEMVVERGFVREFVLEKGVGNWRFADKAIIYAMG